MEAEKQQAAPRCQVVRNVTKVRSLVYLELVYIIYGKGATAREVAKGTGEDARSLYVLLARWDLWGLVVRDLYTSPFKYTIAGEGERYISKLDKWFFPGYYSKKRLRRIPGYRGNTQKLRGELAAANGMVLLSYDTSRGELFYFKAPYSKGSDFVREPIIDGRRKDWGMGVRAKEYDTIGDAFKTLRETFGSSCNPAGFAMIAANIGYYAESKGGGDER